MNKEKDVIIDLCENLKAYKPVAIMDNYRDAAVLVAITSVEDDICLVLTRRAQHLNLHPGEAAFPGGKKDPEDHTLLMTALREANEEVGLPSSSFELLGELDQKLTRSNIKVTPFVGLIPNAHSLKISSDELDCIYTVPLRFFLNPNNLTVNQVMYQNKLRYVARFDYQGHTIWGITAAIIVDLMNIVFDAGIELDKHKITS